MLKYTNNMVKHLALNTVLYLLTFLCIFEEINGVSNNQKDGGKQGR